MGDASARKVLTPINYELSLMVEYDILKSLMLEFVDKCVCIGAL